MTADTVWVTRTEPGATRLTNALLDAGYRVWKAPVLIVEPVPIAQVPSRCDLAIVVSEQAARYAPPRFWSRCDRIFAIGPQTAAALSLRGVRAFVPRDATSEGLLSGPLAGRRWADMRVSIVAGVGGRELLQDTLTQAGAQVRRLECYRRIPVTTFASLPQDERTDTSRTEPGNIGAVIASSGAAVEQVAALAPGLRRRPVVVPSERVAAQARALGFIEVLEGDGAGIAAVLEALEKHPQTCGLRDY